MASRGYSVVINEPGPAHYQPQPQPRPPQRVDENGELIIAEGIQDTERTCKRVCCFYVLIAIFSVFILSPFLLVLGIYCTHKANTSWRLYLTPAGVHYSSVGPFHCNYRKIFIPLADIQDVSIRTRVQKRYGMVVSTTYTIILRLDPGKYDEYESCEQRYICNCSDGVELHDVENTTEFAAAIAQQRMWLGLATNNNIVLIQ